MKPSEERIQIRSCLQAANQLRDKLAELDHEELWALFLRQDGSLITCAMLTKGTLTSTPFDNRTVIKRALLTNAVAVILIHNHPSGNPQPGNGDIMNTEKIRSACRLMDIKLLDHIILSESSFYSFAEERIIEYINS